jgi:hypothetical protein
MPALTSTVSRTDQPGRPSMPTSQPGEDAMCSVCPHPVDGHDAIGLRFCRATATGGIDRGCVCRPA